MAFHPLKSRRCLRSGYTLLEVLMSISIIVMLAVIVAPMGGNEQAMRLQAARDVLSSDLELAQVYCITEPKNPVVVVFNSNGYWLAYAGDPQEPILRAGTNDPYVVVFGQGRAAAAEGVTMQYTGMADDTLVYNAHGGLVNFKSEPTIRMRIAAGGPVLQLRIAPTTGTITESWG